MGMPSIFSGTVRPLQTHQGCGPSRDILEIPCLMNLRILKFHEIWENSASTQHGRQMEANGPLVFFHRFRKFGIDTRQTRGQISCRNFERSTNQNPKPKPGVKKGDQKRGVVHSYQVARTVRPIAIAPKLGSRKFRRRRACARQVEQGSVDRAVENVPWSFISNDLLAPRFSQSKVVREKCDPTPDRCRNSQLRQCRVTRV